MEINPSLDPSKITFKMNNFESKAILTLKESRSNDSASIQNSINHKFAKDTIFQKFAV
jgi:hypothetical protein